MNTKVFMNLIVLMLLVACQPRVEQTEIVKIEATAVPIISQTGTATETAVMPTLQPTIKPTSTNIPLPTNTLEPTQTATIKPSPTSTKIPDTLDPFSMKRLVTASQLSEFSDEIGIIEWEIKDESEWDYRLCRYIGGVSWSVSPNLAINCLFKISSNDKLEDLIPILFEDGYLYDTAVPVESSLKLANEHAFYAAMAEENGHSVYDLFFIDGEVLYWASVDVGTPGGYNPEMLFEEIGDVIEAFLYEMLMINLGESKSEIGEEGE